MKRYLHELTEEELKKVWDNNEKLRNNYFQSMYESNMFLQQEMGEILLPKECNRYYEIKDSYNSFFLTLKDGYNFMENEDINTLKDYGVITEKQIKRYKKAQHLYKGYRDHDIWTDKALQVIEDIAKEVLKNIENYLHEFEDVDYSTAFCDWYNEIDETCEIYITDNTYKAYCDFTKCYA